MAFRSGQRVRGKAARSTRTHAYLWQLEGDLLSEGEKELRVEWAKLLKKYCPEKLVELVL